MNQLFKIDGLEYESSCISQKGQEILRRLNFIQTKLQELENNIKLFSKAKNSYIEDMKTEIIQERTGVDFSDLFSGE